MGFQQTPNEPPRGPGGGGVAPLRIGRGAEVLCTDGTFGTVQQVIMDPTTSELQAIVVQPLGSREEVVIGIGHVERAGNNQVHLNVSRQTLRENPTIARPYNASRYVPVSPEAALPPEQAAGIASAADQPVVTGLERNAVDVIAPAHEVQSGVQPGVQPGVRGKAPRERLTANWHTPGNIASVAPQQMGPAETEAALQQAREAPSGAHATARRSQEQERTPMTTRRNRSQETPQTPSAPREAQELSHTTESAASLNAPETVTTRPSVPSTQPSWLTPALLAAGTALLVGGVTFGAIAWQRSRQPTGLDWWRAQLRQFARNPQKTSRKLAQAVGDTMSKNIQDWTPQLTDATTQASDQLDAWRSLLAEQIDAWRDVTGEQAVSNLKQFTKTASKNASKGVTGWIATLGALGELAGDQLGELSDTLGNQVEDWRDVLSGALASSSPSLAQSLGSSAKSVTGAPRRAVRRGMVGMRWFRRGIFFGSLGGALIGLLVAPVPGSQLRTMLLTRFQQLTGQARTITGQALRTREGATPTGTAGTSGTTGTTGTTGGTLSGTRPIG